MKEYINKIKLGKPIAYSICFFSEINSHVECSVYNSIQRSVTNLVNESIWSFVVNPIIRTIYE